MTLQTLEYFIAVAQYQNFTKAAQACHVTQPALSRAIRALEEELGCALLLRSGRTAVLTPEGEVCLGEARRILRQCGELKERVRQAQQRSQPPLRMGYVITGYLNAFMQFLYKETGAGLPFRMETVYDTVPGAKRRLTSGEVDAALLPEPCVVDLEGVEYMYLQRSRLHAIVHKANPLYERPGIYLAQLRDQPFVLWKEESLPLIRARVFHLCGEAGFVPRIVEEGEKMGDILAQISLHNGVGVGSALFIGADVGDCRYIPILDSPKKFGTVCVWREGNVSPALTELKGILLSGDRRSHKKKS